VISSFEVGATFRIVNEASPQITKILRQVRELNAAIDKAKASMAGLAKIPGLTAAIGETNALATAWREVAGASGAATRAMGRATGRTNAIAGPGGAAALAQTQALTHAYNQLAASMANVRAAGSGPRVGLPGGASGGGGGGNRGVFRPGARGGGGGGVHGGPGMHIGGPSIGIPGGGHIRFGGALAAGGGFVAYGAYEAAQMEDAVFQLNYHAGLEQNDSNRKRFRDVLQESMRTSGFSLHDTSEAAKQEVRMFAGTPGRGLDVLPEMLRAATIEARLKGESPEESMKALIGLAHMTKQYDPVDQEIGARVRLPVDRKPRVTVFDRASGRLCRSAAAVWT
jgi:hypothetical protein